MLAAACHNAVAASDDTWPSFQRAPWRGAHVLASTPAPTSSSSTTSSNRGTTRKYRRTRCAVPAQGDLQPLLVAVISLLNTIPPRWHERARSRHDRPRWACIPSGLTTCARACAAEARRQRGGMPAATTSLAKTFIGTLATHGPFLQQRRAAAAFLLGKGDSARVIEAPGHMTSREE